MYGIGIGMWPGRRRRFKRGMLKYVVLKLLEADERHGYELMRHFSERGWGRLAASSLYPLLATLEERGYIEGREEDGKRTYRITEKGKQRLRDVADDLSAELDDDDDDEPSQAPGSDLKDAMHRLSGAVSQAAHGAKPETIGQIVERVNALRKEIYTLLANE